MMIQTVQQTIEKYDLLQHGDKVLVALSGGADSVCLLSVMLKLKDDYHLSICAAHVNHGLRGAESDADEKFVRKLCGNLDVPIFCKTVDVTARSKKYGVSIEEAGRNARYEFFEELKEQHTIDKIATAHHLNDNVETVLMRIFRGTGIKGLSGIPYQNDWGIIRPLLNVMRVDIEAYLKTNNISFVIDSSNLNDDYTRNKIRHHIIPVAKTINPGFLQTASSNIELFSECSDYIELEAIKKFQMLATISQDMIVFPILQLQDEHPFLVKNLIYKALMTLERKNYTSNTIQLIYNKMNNNNDCIQISKQLNAYILYDKLFIVNNKAVTSFFYSINELPKEIFIIENNCKFMFSICRTFEKTNDNNTVYLDYETLKDKKITIRNRQNGDYFYPSGLGHKKKLKDYFIDEKIPVFLRDRIPLLLADDDIVWVCGHRIDDRFKINKDYKEILKVQMIKGKTNERAN